MKPQTRKFSLPFVTQYLESIEYCLLLEEGDDSKHWLVKEWNNVKNNLKSNSSEFREAALIKAHPKLKGSPIQALDSIYRTIINPPSKPHQEFAINFALHLQKEIYKALSDDVGSLFQMVMTAQAYQVRRPGEKPNKLLQAVYSEARDLQQYVDGVLFTFFKRFFRENGNPDNY